MPVHPDHLSLEPGETSEFLKSYACPAGSVVFFTCACPPLGLPSAAGWLSADSGSGSCARENLCHAGPPWQREDSPRIAVLSAYSHIATNWHRLSVPNETIESLSLERQALFRQPWQADFRRTDHLTKGARGGSDTQPREPATESNTVERFVRVMSEGQEEERREDGRVVFRRSDGKTELIDALH